MNLRETPASGPIAGITRIAILFVVLAGAVRYPGASDVTWRAPQAWVLELSPMSFEREVDQELTRIKSGAGAANDHVLLGTRALRQGMAHAAAATPAERARLLPALSPALATLDIFPTPSDVERETYWQELRERLDYLLAPERIERLVERYVQRPTPERLETLAKLGSIAAEPLFRSLSATPTLATSLVPLLSRIPGIPACETDDLLACRHSLLQWWSTRTGLAQRHPWLDPIRQTKLYALARVAAETAWETSRTAFRITHIPWSFAIALGGWMIARAIHRTRMWNQRLGLALWGGGAVVLLLVHASHVPNSTYFRSALALGLLLALCRRTLQTSPFRRAIGLPRRMRDAYNPDALALTIVGVFCVELLLNGPGVSVLLRRLLPTPEGALVTLLIALILEVTWGVRHMLLTRGKPWG